MKKYLKFILILFLISVFVTLFSVFYFRAEEDFIPIYDKILFCENNKEVKCCECIECFLAFGFPFPFLIGDINGLDFIFWNFSLEFFIVDLIFYFTIVYSIYFLVKKFSKKDKN